MTTTQTIEIQYKDGTDETVEGGDLSARWEILADGDTRAIQYAAYRTPSRKGDGRAVRGYFGESREDRAERIASQQAARAEADKDAERNRIASRTWEYSGYIDSLGWRAPC